MRLNALGRFFDRPAQVEYYGEEETREEAEEALRSGESTEDRSASVNRRRKFHGQSSSRLMFPVISRQEYLENTDGPRFLALLTYLSAATLFTILVPYWLHVREEQRQPGVAQGKKAL